MGEILSARIDLDGESFVTPDRLVTEPEATQEGADQNRSVEDRLIPPDDCARLVVSQFAPHFPTEIVWESRLPGQGHRFIRLRSRSIWDIALMLHRMLE